MESKFGKQLNWLGSYGSRKSSPAHVNTQHAGKATQFCRVVRGDHGRRWNNVHAAGQSQTYLDSSALLSLCEKAEDPFSLEDYDDKDGEAERRQKGQPRIAQA